ncbi:hypothetical protein BGZ59_007123 [Podila verticillata]|nr:hypothetical protein BGZ59_007123 [Podila verticillata]
MPQSGSTTTMKSFLTLLLVAWLACLHQTLAQAPPVSNSGGPTTTTTNSTAPPVATPGPPTFINTPGLQITSPFDGVTIAQNTRLTIGANIVGLKPIASVYISIGKKDGTLNTTIVDLKGLSSLSVVESWNATAAIFTPGDYLLNIIITPNNTAIPPATPPPAGGNSTTTPTTTAAPPVTTPAGPQVYYWQGTVRVALPATANVPSPSAGTTLVGLGMFVQMATTLGVLALGCVIAL